MVFHCIRIHLGIPKLMLCYPRGPVLLHGSASFHSSVHGPRCCVAVCSNGVQPCMEISTLMMMRPSCCFVASRARGQERRRDRKQKQSCGNVMRREDGSSENRVPLFRPCRGHFLKGFRGNSRNFWNWSVCTAKWKGRPMLSPYTRQRGLTPKGAVFCLKGHKAHVA